MDEDMRPEEGERRGNPTDELLTPYTSFTVPWLRRLQPWRARYSEGLAAMRQGQDTSLIWCPRRVGSDGVIHIGLLSSALPASQDHETASAGSARQNEYMSRYLAMR
uniref:Uncharacterized protein n=1 Tax=Oryza rufipogon TaxID=4529 RepID=A0A0E0Q185_ORYRU